MSLANFFGFNATSNSPVELPDIFPVAVTQSIFVDADIENIYAKIITDVLERTQGLPEKSAPLLWDNCVQSEASDGLVTLLSKAMADKKDLFVVYNKALGVVRKATSTEEEQIKSDYTKAGKSAVGVFISFKNYTRSDMVRLYSGMEYCTISALSKSLNVSKAIQFKMSDLRQSVNLNDSTEPKAQAVAMCTALGAGKNILMDAKDEIVLAKPELEAIKESIMFLDAKRCFYLGMPMSYINGEMQKGLGDSGQADARAVDRGLKNYFFSIVKPALEAIFSVTLTYKSNDMTQLLPALEAMKTFAITDDVLLPIADKIMIIRNLLGLNVDQVPTK